MKFLYRHTTYNKKNKFSKYLFSAITPRITRSPVNSKTRFNDINNHHRQPITISLWIQTAGMSNQVNCILLRFVYPRGCIARARSQHPRCEHRINLLNRRDNRTEKPTMAKQFRGTQTSTTEKNATRPHRCFAEPRYDYRLYDVYYTISFRGATHQYISNKDQTCFGLKKALWLKCFFFGRS